MGLLQNAQPSKIMQAPGRGSVKGAVLEPPSRSITRPQAMVFAGIGKNQRARCKMIHFATSPYLNDSFFSVLS
jgi:hypothetical protein